MESTSYAIFLCTRHNVPGNFSYKHDIVPGKSAQDNSEWLAEVLLRVSPMCKQDAMLQANQHAL
ncbi:hypothetical protein T06_8482 [Trichinella sp. T6]|nr:hypothetical protein T06_8482 [Trichinella sp. T6]